MVVRTRYLVVAAAMTAAGVTWMPACGVGEVAHQADQVERDVRVIDKSSRRTGKLLKKRIDKGHGALRDLSREGERITEKLLGP